MGQEEPRWLATDLTDPLADLGALDDRRMGLEEQLRETKGCRFIPPHLPLPQLRVFAWLQTTTAIP